MTLCDDLRLSGARWASAALQAYSTVPQDYDFAIHHMAVAVEHVSKAYLASITEILLIEERPNIDDILVLAGQEDRTARRRSDIKTISGSGAIARTEKLLGKSSVDAENLRRLRELRNGITHLAQGVDPIHGRQLLSGGVRFINDLLIEMGFELESFWRDRMSLAENIVENAITDVQLRYDAKLLRARETFEARFRSVHGVYRSQALRALSSVPFLTRWALVSSTSCPACGNPAMLSGREYSEDFGTWFTPKFFGCRVCDLQLEGEELRLAGFGNRFLDEGEEYEEQFDHEYDEDDEQ